MEGRGGPVIDAEIDPEILKGFFVLLVIFIHDLPRRDPFLLGLHGDGCPVFIRTTDECHILPALPQITNVNVGRKVSACDMPDMEPPVSVG